MPVSAEGIRREPPGWGSVMGRCECISTEHTNVSTNTEAAATEDDERALAAGAATTAEESVAWVGGASEEVVYCLSNHPDEKSKTFQYTHRGLYNRT